MSNPSYYNETPYNRSSSRFNQWGSSYNHTEPDGLFMDNDIDNLPDDYQDYPISTHDPESIVIPSRSSSTLRNSSRLSEGFGTNRLGDGLSGSRMTDSFNTGRMNDGLSGSRMTDGLSGSRMNDGLSGSRMNDTFNPGRMTDGFNTGRITDGFNTDRMTDSFNPGRMTDSLNDPTFGKYLMKKNYNVGTNTGFRNTNPMSLGPMNGNERSQSRGGFNPRDYSSGFNTQIGYSDYSMMNYDNDQMNSYPFNGNNYGY